MLATKTDTLHIDISQTSVLNPQIKLRRITHNAVASMSFCQSTVKAVRCQM